MNRTDGEPTRIYLIGVGPGDPELLTLRAARLIERCDVLLHAGPSDRSGFAVEVIGPLLRSGQRTQGMALSMKRGPDDGSVGYDRVARALLEHASEGRTVAFLTEGDPLLFGTSSYVLEHLQAIAPCVAVEVVPGVSAISAAAARLGWPLAQKAEVLTICPATYHAEQLGTLLERGGSICLLKAAGVLPTIVAELRRRGRLDRAALIEKVGRPDERIFRNLEEALGQDLSYFSLVLVR
ncbi:MAG: precorrin-2 C(20)-methyltransferase [Isosphaeraceae bacterium]|nr:precorrin-2 C(20)-methyltransferase [Isosphaeraceae bacterium]